MEVLKFTLISTILLTTTIAPTATEPRFRSDYEYNKVTNAFYKLHVETVRLWLARQTCLGESAKLMVPTSTQDMKQVHAMLKKFPDIGDYVWVEEDGQTHESAEEHPIINLQPRESEEQEWSGRCDVGTRQGEVESVECFQNLPFMCKVEAQDAFYDRHCDVYGRGYQYFSSAGSCYKVPVVSGTWSQAYDECQAEGAHLVVINSQQEMSVVQNMVKSIKVVGSKFTWFFFAGFRADKEKPGEQRVFKTIYNQTLAEAGFNIWSENEPNNHENSEYCGSIFVDGKFNDVNCAENYGYVCEKEVHLSS